METSKLKCPGVPVVFGVSAVPQSVLTDHFWDHILGYIGKPSQIVLEITTLARADGGGVSD